MIGTDVASSPRAPPRKGGNSVPDNTIIEPGVAKAFEDVMERGRVLFFSAPCGFGKSTLASALPAGRKVLRKSADEADCFTFRHQR